MTKARKSRADKRRKASRPRSARKDAGTVLPAVIQRNSLDVQFLRGDIAVDQQAADPENPAREIDRAYRMSSFMLLYRRKTITGHQFDAAEKYAQLHEVFSGGVWRNGESIGGGRAFWDREPASEAQLIAGSSIRAVNEALGKWQARLMFEFVVEDLRIKELAVRHKRAPGPMQGEVIAALIRCVEFWNLDNTRSGRARIRTISV